MTTYVLTYHGGSDMADDPVEHEKEMAAWGAWFGQMGPALVAEGNPLVASRTVHPDGSTTDGGPAPELSGYSLITADSFEAALAVAKGCPVLADGGTVQVSEAVDV
ncbi:MAG: hypothetical protein AAF962_14710 [Actinomycetota bacterium]